MLARVRSLSLLIGISDEIEAATIAMFEATKKSAKMCSVRSEFLLCLFSCFRRGCAERAKSVGRQKIMICDDLT